MSFFDALNVARKIAALAESQGPAVAKAITELVHVILSATDPKGTAQRLLDEERRRQDFDRRMRAKGL